MNIQIQRADESHIEELVEMNQRLVVDEQFDRPRPIDLIEKRWRQFFEKQYSVVLFRAEEKTIGYSLVNDRRQPAYLEHFFIREEYRRQGIGSRAFDLLMEELNVKEMDLEVMIWNERGRSFWKSVGGTERTTGMTIRRS
jgi:predicted acetyltransferase